MTARRWCVSGVICQGLCGRFSVLDYWMKTTYAKGDKVSNVPREAKGVPQAEAALRTRQSRPAEAVPYAKQQHHHRGSLAL